MKTKEQDRPLKKPLSRVERTVMICLVVILEVVTVFVMSTIMIPQHDTQNAKPSTSSTSISWQKNEDGSYKPIKITMKMKESTN